MSKRSLSVGDRFVVSNSVKRIKECGGLLVSQLLAPYAGQVMQVTEVLPEQGGAGWRYAAKVVDSTELGPIGIPDAFMGQKFFTRVRLGRAV